jgi:PilZ domain
MLGQDFPLGGGDPLMKIKRNAKTGPVPARRVLRREVDWVTRYMLEGNRDQVWRECRVLDVSRGGAGVELSGTTVEEARAHRVVLEFEVPLAVLRLRGEVRHVGPGSDGGVHVGLQFASLTALERDMFDSLLERGSSNR